MGYEKRKAPKVKVKRKDDDVVEKIEMKKRKSPARKATTVSKKVTKPVKHSNDNSESTFQILKGGIWNKKQKKRNSVITAAIIGAIIISIILAQFITPTGVVEWSQNMFSTWGNGGGLPVSVSGDNIRDLKARNDSVFVMTDSHMYAYNSSGKQITSIQHGYTEPAFVLSAARTLIYDRGSFGIRTDALYTNIINTQLEEEIITADICDKGYVAVATQSTDYTAHVTVFDKKFKSLFRWSSPDGYVSCLELSNNGKYVAVCTVTGKNGDYCSNINVFRLSNGEKVFNKEILGSMYVSASSTNKHITLAGTDSVVSFKWDGTDQVSHEYYNLELVNMDYSGRRVFVHHPDGDERRFTVSLLGNDCRESSSFSVDGNISRVCADKKYVFTYYNGIVKRYLHNGEFDREFNVGYEYVFITPYKNKLSVVSDMKLDTLK